MPQPAEASPSPEPRTLTLGARLAVVLGLLLWVGAAVVFFTPIWVELPDGAGRSSCGTPMDPLTDAFQPLRCGPEPEARRVLGLGLLGAGLVVAAGGVAAFGLRPAVPVGDPTEAGSADATPQDG